MVEFTDEERQRYIGISPKYQVSLIKIETDRYENIFKIIFEPYRVVVDDKIEFEYAYSLNVYKAITTGIPDLSINMYSYPSNVDSEELNAIYNTGGEQSDILYFYYDDMAEYILSSIDLNQGYSLIDHVYDKMFSKMIKSGLGREEARYNLLKCINASINLITGCHTMTEEEVDNLITIVSNRRIDSKDQVDSLNKLLSFTNKITTYEIDPIIIQTLFVLEYSDKLDLDEIKSKNRLYTILIVRTAKRIEGAAYVVMYREPPIEFRKESNSGFSTEELVKILR
jgi:hypothetical protein